MAQVFDGITVLDFTSGRAGGVATMVMSDFGAEVIKIEPPGGEKFRDAPGAIQWNRGKKSVVLDLKTPDGQEKAHALAQYADRGSRELPPGRRVSGWALTTTPFAPSIPAWYTPPSPALAARGPYAHYKGYDAVVAAKSGRMMMFANQNPRPGPNFVVTQGVCHAAATALVRGITAALYLREKTGRGQQVETSMLQAVTTYDHVSWVHGQMVRNRPDEYPPEPQRRHRARQPHRIPACPHQRRPVAPVGQRGRAAVPFHDALPGHGLYLRRPPTEERSLSLTLRPSPISGADYAGESPAEDPGRVDVHIPQQGGQRRRRAVPDL